LLGVDFPSINFEFGSYARADAGMHYVLKWANTELEGLSPDIVISKFGLYSLRTDESLVANGVDFENLKHYIESEPTGIRYRVMHTSHLARWVDVLYQKRKINNFYDSLAGKNPALVFLPQQKQQYWKAPMYQGEPKISNRLFGKKTIYLARKVKEIGARHIMLGQPLLYHPDMEYQQSGEEVRIISNSASIKERLASIHLLIDDGKEMLRLSPRAFLSEMKRFNQMQERVAQREGVLYVGLEDLTGKSENFYDDFMFTDTGSKQVSELVYPILKEEVKEVLAGRTNQIFQ